MTLRTRYERLTVPVRGYDWRALERPYSIGDPIGWGSTEAEAIAHLRILQDDKSRFPERWTNHRVWTKGWGDRASPRSYGDVPLIARGKPKRRQ